MTESPDDGFDLTGPLPARWQPARRPPLVERPEFGRGGSAEQRAIGLAADLAAIGWRVRRARAVARWLALSGEDSRVQ
jgi:hypothetical protein